MNQRAVMLRLKYFRLLSLSKGFKITKLNKNPGSRTDEMINF